MKGCAETNNANIGNLRLVVRVTRAITLQQDLIRFKDFIKKYQKLTDMSLNKSVDFLFTITPRMLIWQSSRAGNVSKMKSWSKNFGNTCNKVKSSHFFLQIFLQHRGLEPAPPKMLSNNMYRVRERQKSLIKIMIKRRWNINAKGMVYENHK